VRILILLCSLSVVGCVSSTQFQAYQGNNNIFKGEGGTVIKEEGIDIWTSGTPPCEYKVIGVVNDTRNNSLVAGWTIKGDIANAVRKNGGDAAILTDMKEHYVGTMYNSSTYVNTATDTIANATYYGNNNYGNLSGSASSTGYGSANTYASSTPMYNYASRFTVVKYITSPEIKIQNAQ
jgi:hypothetical protein